MATLAVTSSGPRRILNGTQAVTVEPGALVLVRHGEDDSYGAVIVELRECTAALTFTPEGVPREVPLGMILCSIGGSEGATLDLSSIPEYQPNPTRTPRRSRRRAEADVRLVQ